MVTSCSKVNVNSPEEYDINMPEADRLAHLYYFRWLMGWTYEETGVDQMEIEFVDLVMRATNSPSDIQVARLKYVELRKNAAHSIGSISQLCSKCLWAHHSTEACDHSSDMGQDLPREMRGCANCGNGKHSAFSCPLDNPVCIVCAKMGHHHLACQEPLAVFIRTLARKYVKGTRYYAQVYGQPDVSEAEEQEAIRALAITQEDHWLFM